MHVAVIMIAALLGMAGVPDTLRTARITAGRDASVSSSVPLLRASSLQMERSGARGLAEVLRTMPGVSVKDYGGLGGLKTVSIRSFGSQHTSFCYDGMVVSDAQNGQVDISRFNLDDLEAVSVSIAGNEDIFRSARLLSSVGTVSLVSAPAMPDSCATEATVRMRAASFGTYNPYIRVRRRISDRWSGSVWTDWLSSRGDYPFTLTNGSMVTRETRLNSDVSTLKGEVKLHGEVGRDGEIAFRANILNSGRGLPGSVVLYTQDPHERLYDRSLISGISYVGSAGEHWRIKADMGFSSSWNRYVNISPLYPEPLDDRYLQRECSLSAVALWKPCEGWEVSIAQDIWANTLDSNMEECPLPQRLSSVCAVSARWSSQRLSITSSLSATVMRERVRKGQPAPGRERLSPSVSICWKVLEDRDLRLRASYREGFRVPTFNDLYYARVGNVWLQPETSRQLNLGVGMLQPLDRGQIAVTADLHADKVHNKIVAIPTMFIWRMRNVGEAAMLGGDLSVRYDQRMDACTLHATAAWSYQYAVDVTDPEAKNYRHQIAYAPRNSGSLSLAAETRPLTLSYTLVAVGERYSLAQNLPSYRMEPYLDHSLSLSREFRAGARARILLSAQALNLTGRTYEVIKWYPMPGRNYRFTIKLTY